LNGLVRGRQGGELLDRRLVGGDRCMAAHASSRRR
jgi:hypothetical protein